MQQEIQQNPFFNKTYDTPLESVPFDKICFEHYEQAMLEGMKRDDQDIERITNNPEQPTFENTVIPKPDNLLVGIFPRATAHSPV